MQPVFAINEDRFPGENIPDELVVESMEDGVFRSDHVLLFHSVAALPELQRADAVRVSKSQNSLTADERDCGIRAFAFAHERFYCAEDVLGCKFPRMLVPEGNGKNVEKHFGVGIGIEMVVFLLHQSSPQIHGIGEAAVMGECDAKWRRDEKWLCFEFTAASGCRVAHMPDAHRSLQACQGSAVKDVAHHAVAFLQVELVIVGHNSCSILPSMLEDDETIIQILDDVSEAGGGDNATHVRESGVGNGEIGRRSTRPCGIGCAVPKEMLFDLP